MIWVTFTSNGTITNYNTFNGIIRSRIEQIINNYLDNLLKVYKQIKRKKTQFLKIICDKGLHIL
ncbi:hypothetical protein BpHYR1_049970 [Brachionus plicatilis]|uniref:Uncharacterized protein n=1 Tax=Brachionus plicatilis TaxID=10195 RepID=A0A3M7Q167_BRAPC|nr:hypothetical protein BpHYR1_049970 [Brachionus plicatilis]